MSIEEKARLLALAEASSPSLNGKSADRLATQLDEVGLEATLQGETAASFDQDWVPAALDKVDEGRVEYWHQELESLFNDGVSLLLVTDADYPANLRVIVNRPPLLFVRGHLAPTDTRAVAIVGTRNASDEGVATADQLARDLVGRGVTIVSGLAAGIDTAAHEAALSSGGRTIAVFGTGITRVYPGVNKPLARRVAESGACVSQFLPRQTGQRWTFPVRNIVTSGMSLGTVVVEASETSGARRQAEEALNHGKRLFLMDRLVMGQEWGRALVGHPGVSVISSTDQLVDELDYELGVPDLDVLV